MGTVVSSIQNTVQYCRDKGAKQVATEVINNIYDKGNVAYQGINEFLDFLSANACPEKPTLHLVSSSLNLPIPDRDLITAVIANIVTIFSWVTIPVKMVSDKKFATHVYETSFIFQNNVGQVNPNNSITMCEKVLIYISDKIDSVAEQRQNQIVQSITINGNDYDVPINLWYTFNMQDTRKFYFFIYISITTGYKGILFAVNKEETDIFDIIKEEVKEHYTKNLGRQVQTSSRIYTISDILTDDDEVADTADNADTADTTANIEINKSNDDNEKIIILDENEGAEGESVRDLYW